MLFVQIVNPEIDRGRPPRNIQLRDIITVPVRRSGTFTLMDMISDDSIRNVIQVHNALTGPERKRKAAVKAPAKRKA